MRALYRCGDWFPLGAKKTWSQRRVMSTGTNLLPKRILTSSRLNVSRKKGGTSATTPRMSKCGINRYDRFRSQSSDQVRQKGVPSILWSFGVGFLSVLKCATMYFMIQSTEKRGTKTCTKVTLSMLDSPLGYNIEVLDPFNDVGYYSAKVSDGLNRPLTLLVSFLCYCWSWFL